MFRVRQMSARGREQSWRWEVLNFGISNYGIGQYLLAWEEHVRLYEPDYVAIFVARFHMSRSVTRYAFGAFPASRKVGLWVRPTFRLENDQLIREAAADFDEFVRMQDNLIKTEFDGKRSRRRSGVVTLHYLKRLRARLASRLRALHPPKGGECA